MLTVTTRAFLLSQQTKIEPQIILTISGFDTIFGVVDVTTVAKYGMDNLFYGQDDLVYGGVITDPNSKSYINLKGATTKTIQQQLQQDKGGVASVSQFVVELINKNRELSDSFVPDNIVSDLLSRDAQVYLTFQGGSFPEDAVKIIDGTISSAQYKAGAITITVSHPEEAKRQEIYLKYESVLTNSINSSTTTIPVSSTLNFIESNDSLTSFIRIDDEVMEVVSKTSNSFTVIRGSLGTVQDSHSIDAAIESLYQLEGRPIELALKLLLSGHGEYYSTLPVQNFNFPQGFVAGTIVFNVQDLNDKNGVVAGDRVVITGTAFNDGEYTILSVEKNESYSYLIVDATFSNEAGIGEANFISKYNVLTEGAGLKPQFIDILQHEFYEETFSTSFPEMRFYLKDTIKVKEFIDSEIYFVNALYSIPRKGRASLGYAIPPLNFEGIQPITANTITNISSISMQRSIKSDFYNAIVHRYNEQLLEDKLIASEVLLSQNSINRIPVGTKPLTIESRGFRRDAETINVINRIQSRLIGRYEFAAKRISQVEILYRDGFYIEVGDIISFGSGSELIDPDTGEYAENLFMEVVNKSFDVTGRIRLDLLDTNYNSNARFSTISPSSNVLGGDSDSIQIDMSFASNSLQEEASKWIKFIGEVLLIHNDDYTESEEFVLAEVSTDGGLFLIPEDSLTLTPDSDHFVNVCDYANSGTFSRSAHGFLGRFDTIDNSITSNQFEVDGVHPIFVGDKVVIISALYDYMSNEVAVTNVDGLIITVEDNLGVSVDAGDIVEIIGFEDGGKGYRIL